MTEITCDQTPENGSKPLLFDICSAMKNAGRESVDALFPTLTIKHCCGVPSI